MSELTALPLHEQLRAQVRHDYPLGDTGSLMSRAADALERAKKIEDAARGADLKCQVYGDQDLTCIEYRNDFIEEQGFTPTEWDEPLCDHCSIYAALTPDPAPLISETYKDSDEPPPGFEESLEMMKPAIDAVPAEEVEAIKRGATPDNQEEARHE